MKKARHTRSFRSARRLVAALSVCALLASASTAALGQSLQSLSGEYLETVWNTEDGLPQNSVNAILQTRDGYLWLATFGGLARFDGIKFTIFNTGNTPGLKANRILSLYEARDSTIWIGTDSGDVMSFKDGVGKTYTKADGLPGSWIMSIGEDGEGTLWIGTTSHLVRFRDGKFKAYTAADGFPEQSVYYLAADGRGDLWLTASSGLVRLRAGAFTTFSHPGWLNNFYLPAHLRPDGSIWTHSKTGLALFKDGQFINQPGPAAIAGVILRTLFEDRRGYLWFYQPGRLVRFKDGDYGTYQLKSVREGIRAMYEDREGNLWLGADGGGLVRLKRRRVLSYTQADGLPSDSIRGITSDGAGGVWIATYDGLARFQGGKLTPFAGESKFVSNDTSALCLTRDGALWVGSGAGLTRIKDGALRNYREAEGLPHKRVNAIMEDREGDLWIGTEEGLYRLRGDRFDFWHAADGLISENVIFLMQARDGAIWIGTVKGLSRFQDGAFRSYTTAEGLSNDQVRDIYEEEDGTLWIGTYGGGLCRYRDGSFKPVTARDGLFDDFISRILPDDRGNLWMLSNRGIFRVSRRELDDFAEGRAASITSISYGIADGMVSREANGGRQPAGCRADDGRMWFPTIKGVVVIDPREDEQFAPPVAIEQVVIDRAVLAAGTQIEIGPESEDLEIHYTALSFTRPELVRYKYRLAGYDEAWVDVGTRRAAYYSHLPPGEYTFTVIADNGSGVWNTEGRSIVIRVIPPFWRTWWFMTLAGLALISASILAYRQRVAHLHRRNAAQEAFSRQLIASQEQERQRIAAELHDSLGQNLLIIKNRASLGALTSKDLEAAKKQLLDIGAAASQAIEEVRQIAYNLRPYHLDRLGLANSIEAMLEKVAASSGIEFYWNIAAIDGALPKEAEINLYRVVQECLNNIVKHSGATEARVTVANNGQSVQVTVQDNGKGMGSKAGNEGGRQGFGLTGIAERVRMLGGTHTIQSMPGQGTTVNIKLPLTNGRKPEKK